MIEVEDRSEAADRHAAAARENERLARTAAARAAVRNPESGVLRAERLVAQREAENATAEQHAVAAQAEAATARGLVAGLLAAIETEAETPPNDPVAYAEVRVRPELDPWSAKVIARAAERRAVHHRAAAWAAVRTGGGPPVCTHRTRRGCGGGGRAAEAGGPELSAQHG